MATTELEILQQFESVFAQIDGTGSYTNSDVDFRTEYDEPSVRPAIRMTPTAPADFANEPCGFRMVQQRFTFIGFAQQGFDDDRESSINASLQKAHELKSDMVRALDSKPNLNGKAIWVDIEQSHVPRNIVNINQARCIIRVVVHYETARLTA